MKYFLSAEGEILAFEADGSQDHAIPENVVSLSEADALSKANPSTPPSLETLRSAAQAQLPAWESAERAAGIDHAGHQWLTTSAALQDIRDALLAGLVPDGVWIDAERHKVPMTLDTLRALWAACVSRGATIYQRRLEMEAEIESMEREQLEQFFPSW
ncbi:DUF4376 domain-containing protein [Chitiniphilus eburneus]|uniref:DUF4376 domain-containing protein n=2 Tax=Chitiniphilus eburneus TaxID=2571148 RepID=A0A4U0QCQ1_9NEIS|nr:DUF4376 domain-containing protein [Chitiniphilus eburneus]